MAQYDHRIYVFPKGSIVNGFFGAAGACDQSDGCLIYMFPRDNFCGNASTYVHEFGHNLGLNHSGKLLSDGTVLSAGDSSCIMSYASVTLPHLNMPQKIYAQFVENAAILTVQNSGEFTLFPNESTQVGVPRALKIAVPGQSYSYIVSFRKRLDEYPKVEDSLFNSQFNNHVSVHRVVETEKSTILMALFPILTDQSVGFIDVTNLIRVNVVSVMPDSIRVRVVAPYGRGLCGESLNSCFVGTVVDVPDDPSNYLWQCVQGNEDQAVNCSLPKPPGGDTIPPSVQIISPNDKISYSLPQDILFKINASDNIGVTKVELFRNGQLVKTFNAAPYEYKWAISSLDNGNYAWYAKAYDGASNVQDSPTIALTVAINDDSEPPMVVINSPTASSTYSTPGTISVTATVTDNVGVRDVEFYLDNQMITKRTFPPYTYNWQISSALNGNHIWLVKAYDLKGNLGQSKGVSVVVQIGANCALPWGGSLANGLSVTAYKTASVSNGQVCLSEVRTCRNGVLSGQYNFQKCAAALSLQTYIGGTAKAYELLAGKSIAQNFAIGTGKITRILVNAPSYSDNQGNLTLKLYKSTSNYNYNDTIRGTVLATKTFVNFTDNAWLSMDVASIPAGHYLVVISNPVGRVGVWTMQGSTYGGTIFYNGAGSSAADIRMKVEYLP